MNDLLGYLLGGAIIAAFAAGFWYLFRHRRQIQEAFAGFAATHGLETKLGTYPRVEGEIDGRKFSMASERQKFQRGTKQKVLEFHMRLALMTVPPTGLVVYKKGRLEGTGIATGDGAFDKRHKIMADEPQAALAYLTAPRRRALAALSAFEGGLYSGELAIFCLGFKPREAWFEERLQALLAAVKALEQP